MRRDENSWLHRWRQARSAATQPASYLGAAEDATMKKNGREFYQLRRYHIISGPQRKLCDDFFSGVFIPTESAQRLSGWCV